MAVGFDNRLPIYLQIMDHFKTDIITGKLRPGDKMPSVRELAAEMQINPNTIQRALQELEREGLVETKRGTGRYVAGGDSIIGVLKERKVQQLLDRFVSDMLELGLEREEIMAVVSQAILADGQSERGNMQDGTADSP